MDYILQTSQIVKKYNNFTALTGLNMNVPRGSIYGFVGRNGAGKTTLIRIITGLNNPTSGTFTLMGASNTDAAIRQARRKMGAVVETPSLHPEMTARDNLIQHYKTLGLPPTDLENILHLVGLPNTGKKKGKNFSLGMRQRLGLAQALMEHPDILLLDEPLSGLDNDGVQEMYQILLKQREEGKLIVVASHSSEDIRVLCNEIFHFDKGKMIDHQIAEK